ncbi:hypothetical protein DFA_06884 [Cavenderia fasciculata]|uniref:Cyclin N-terminal domain-containing protein n=1 Tax=Cavenderia fasciculata TaxID=261658 RepID=F4PWY0_CACFS|nr:uncharacterized protein DFA_06884 [Cavenderia fasciculata]EGG19783.1 hypothetical protein DFA_06884 [Cavenderia fasciculata]|eukprot:XP_004358129.1 hypothetical protein DFA_06884 [Cavenderia fasciculata]
MLSTNNHFQFTNNPNTTIRCSPYTHNTNNDLVQKIKTYATANQQRGRRNSSYLSRFPVLSNNLSGEAVVLVAKKICDWVVQSNINGKNQQRINLLPLEKMEKGVLEILDTIMKWILDDMNEPPFILFVGIYLADKYVNRVGVRQSQVLWLILTSCIIAIKMYSDSQNISNINIAHKFQTSTKNLLKMESEFLTTIGYNCYVEESTIIAFLTSIYMEHICNITDKSSMLFSLIQQQQQQQLQQQQQQQQN